ACPAPRRGPMIQVPVRPPTPPNIRIDLVAFTLLAAGLLVAVSLFSADAVADATTANLLGPAGAWVARELTDALGAAVYVLLGAWFVLVVLLFLRNSWLIWSIRLVGWTLLVPCAAVGADWIGPETLGGPLAGSGGTLGAWLSHWFAEELGPWARILVPAF